MIRMKAGVVPAVLLALAVPATPAHAAIAGVVEGVATLPPGDCSGPQPGTFTGTFAGLDGTSVVLGGVAATLTANFQQCVAGFPLTGTVSGTVTGAVTTSFTATIVAGVGVGTTSSGAVVVGSAVWTGRDNEVTLVLVVGGP